MLQMKKYIFAVASIVLFSNPVGAKIFAPETDWVVSGFEQSQASSGAFCAMARGFTNDTIITLAKNADQEGSIAIESDIFSLDPSDTYAVVLSSGRDYVTTLDVKPVTGNSFVLKLGQDKKVYDALKKNDRLRVKVASETLDISLGGFEKGYNALNNCVARNPATRIAQKEIMPGSNVVEAKETMTQVPATTQSLVKGAQVPGFIQPVEVAKVEQTNLIDPPVARKTIAELEQDIARIEAEEKSSLQSQLIADRPRVSARQSRLLDIEDGMVQSLNKDKPASPRQPARIAKVEENVLVPQDLLSSLNKENRSLRREIVSSDVGNAKTLNDSLASMQNRDENLLVQLQRQKERIEVLEARERELMNALASGKNGDGSSANTTILNDFQGRIALLEQENASLKTQLGRKQQSYVSSDASAAVEELAKLKRRYAQSEAENKRLGRMLRDARSNVTEIAQLEVKPIDAAMLSSDVSEMDVMPLKQNDRNERVPARFARQTSAVKMPLGLIEEVRNASNATYNASPVASVSSQNTFSTPAVNTTDKVTNILRRASIPLSSIDSVDQISKPGFSVYQWESGDTYGTVEVTKAANNLVFDTLHSAYIERTKRRCNGDFEAVLNESFGNGSDGIAYDVACVSGPNASAVASLYFVYDGSDFMTFAFETTADSFADAMTYRDMLAGSNS